MFTNFKQCSNPICKNPVTSLENLLPLSEFYKRYNSIGFHSRCTYCILNKNKEFRKLNPAYGKTRKYLYDQLHKKERNEYARIRAKNNLQIRLSNNLRSDLGKRIRLSLGSKTNKTVELLGLLIPEFKMYIERLFLPEMTWANWGKTGWHLDHIKPLNSFDLTLISQQKQAFHYTNYQPLWATDNLTKGVKLDWVSNLKK